jgi:hypothetical protein
VDKIIVRTNADMTRVIEWADRLTGVPVKLAFPEAEIEFQEEEILLRFRDEGESVVWFEAEMAGRKVVEWRSNLETGEIPELRVVAEGEKKAKLSMLLAMDNTVAKCVRKFRSLMLFATYYHEEVQRTKVVSRIEKPGKNRKSGKRSNRRMLTVRKYMIGEEVLSELPQPKRKYEKHTESWGVRGHYRTLRSGKTVWVRPYTKGENSGRIDREYYL